MSTHPNSENYTSDFLELEPMSVHKASSTSAKDMGAESWDVDKEINSLFALISSRAQPGPKTTDNSATQLLEQELRQKIMATEALLTKAYEKNEVNAEKIQQSVDQAQQLQGQTEKLARYTKKQAQQVQEMLKSFEQIRQDIITALDRCGDWQQLTPMVQQMGRSELALTRANEQLQTYQANLYESLQQIQQQIENRSAAADSLLQQHQSELTNLLSAVQVDREQLAAMQTHVSEQLQLSTELRHSLVEQSAVFQHNIIDINRNFADLAESVQHEKQQFYQLTAETIDKADAIRSKFAEIGKQVNKDWEAIQSLKFEMEDLRKAFNTEAKQQFQKLNQHYDEMVASWGDIKKKQNHLDRRQHLHQMWLVGITSGMVILFLGAIVLFLK